MGRRKLHKTPEQVAAQRRKWQDARNKRRRKRYAEDPEYRESVKNQARERSRKLSAPLKDRAAACRQAVQDTASYGQKRKMLEGGKRVVLTSRELAAAMGLSHQMEMYKWQRDGRFPRPIHGAIVGRTHANVYTLEESKCLLRKMANHYDKKNYLRKGDSVVAELPECLSE